MKAKKLTALLGLMLVTSLLLVACGTDEATEAPGDGDTGAAPEATDVPAPEATDVPVDEPPVDMGPIT